MQKLAILDQSIQARLLDEAMKEGTDTYIPVWLMMRYGVHPHDVSAAAFSVEDGKLLWQRAKNARPRREAIPEAVRPILEAWLDSSRRLTRIGYNKMVHRLGRIIGCPNLSPLSLRHTYGIELIRQYRHDKDGIDKAALRMGCKRETMLQYYVDLEQWEEVTNPLPSVTPSEASPDKRPDSQKVK